MKTVEVLLFDTLKVRKVFCEIETIQTQMQVHKAIGHISEVVIITSYYCESKLNT